MLVKAGNWIIDDENLTPRFGSRFIEARKNARASVFLSPERRMFLKAGSPAVRAPPMAIGVSFITTE
jgi:hypothetical protein